LEQFGHNPQIPNVFGTNTGRARYPRGGQDKLPFRPWSEAHSFFPSTLPSCVAARPRACARHRPAPLRLWPTSYRCTPPRPRITFLHALLRISIALALKSRRSGLHFLHRPQASKEGRRREERRIRVPLQQGSRIFTMDLKSILSSST